MIIKLVTEKLVQYKIIEAEDIEIVQYGLDSISGVLLGILLTLIIGFCFNDFLAGVLLWCTFFPLRKNAGGYHAKTRCRCFLISVCMLLLSFLVINQVEWNEIMCTIVFMIMFLIVFLFSPVDNPNKELDIMEQMVYAKRTRTILLFESFFFVLAILFKWQKVYVVLTINLCMVATLLVMGIIKIQYVNRKSYRY